MKKLLSKIVLVLLIIFGVNYFLIQSVNAESVAGLNCPPSADVGSNFTVALILPSNAYSAEASVTVKFGDGTTETKKIVYMSGMNDFPNSVTFNAKASGSATVTASNIIISDSASNAIENGGSKVGTINITGTSNNNSSTDNNSSNNTNNSNPANVTVNFKDVNETVYITSGCNVRESYSTSSNKLGKLNEGASVKRTGIADNGWSRVEYNGKTAYISSQFLTTTKPADPTFKQTNDTMYAIQNCNLRKSWSTDSDKVGYLNKGQEVTRIGVANNGWSKIKYNGSEVYIATRLLSDEEPDDTDENEVNNTTNITNTNVVSNETVMQNKSELELIKEEVGVLPDVGKNVFVTFYKIISVISIIIALILIKVYFNIENNNRKS